MSRSGTARFFDGCRDRVFSRGPVKLLGVFIGNTPGGPVVAYLGVCDHEVPLVISPVMQAMGWRNVPFPLRDGGIYFGTAPQISLKS